mmetsp:Transcript_24731/g.27517  ORF Transcript_24731/g.27517 Transcript_24731/m.27517 type:complete len:81 (+) Transcript_24731:2-244(+)
MNTLPRFFSFFSTNQPTKKIVQTPHLHATVRTTTSRKGTPIFQNNRQPIQKTNIDLDALLKKPETRSTISTLSKFASEGE